MTSLNSLKERTCRIEGMEEKLPLAEGGDVYSTQEITAADIQDLIEPPDLPETPEEKVTRLTEVKALTEARIGTLNTTVNEQNDEIARLEDALAQIEQELETLPTITPSFRMETPYYSQSVTLHYTNMPDGMSAQLIDGNTCYKSDSIQQGDGSVRWKLPFTMKTTLAGRVVHTDTGEQVGDTITFVAKYWRVRGEASADPQLLEEIAHREDSSALEAQRTEIEQQTNDLLATRELALQELTEAHALLEQVTEELRIAEAELAEQNDPGGTDPDATDALLSDPQYAAWDADLTGLQVRR